jgi:hypothetical protein
MRVARSTEAFPRTPLPSTDLSTDEATTAEPGPRARGSSGSAGGSSPFGAALHSLGSELDRGESLTDKAIRGASGHVSPEQLIALQAGIYRYSEAVDLVTKVVDKGTQAVRTTIQNQ